MSYAPLGQGLWYFLTSFVGTLGFAILLHAPKRAWLPASLIGAMTYTLYWSLKQLSLDEAASMFLAALFGSLLAQFCARKMRMIATIFLLLLVMAHTQGAAIALLFAFAISMSGLNPTAVASAGRMTSVTSMGIMLPVASSGAILMPWVIGKVAESAGLAVGMATNIVPCVGLIVFAILVSRMREE